MVTDTKTKITCAFCNHRFNTEDSAETCSRCALFGAGGCHKVRCPKCGYEMPAPPRLPGLLARLFKKGKGTVPAIRAGEQAAQTGAGPGQSRDCPRRETD